MVGGGGSNGLSAAAAESAMCGEAGNPGIFEGRNGILESRESEYECKFGEKVELDYTCSCRD